MNFIMKEVYHLCNVTSPDVMQQPAPEFPERTAAAALHTNYYIAFVCTKTHLNSLAKFEFSL